MVWYSLVRFGMVWYGLVWFGMVWYGLVWFGIVRYGLVSSGSKVTVLASLEDIQPHKSEESTLYDATIELAFKNFPKMTPQMLKSVQWFKSYIFGLFRGHTASKK